MQGKYFRRVRRYALILAGVWTSAVCISLIWNLRQERFAVLERARAEARGSSDKDILLQRWISSHGGVYVPVDEQTPPSPYLSHIEERDLETPSGRRLTLLNAAYVMRQLYAPTHRTYTVRGHFTSLKPIRKENAPDPWERSILEAFERGEGEVTAVEELDGQSYMRLMRPMMVTETCLKCHAHQGYKVGDIRGGFSVSIPMAPHVAAARSNIMTLSLAHGFLWLLGMGGIGFGVWRVQNHVRERDLAEEALRDSEERYREFVEETEDLVTRVDGQGKFLFVNKMAARVFGQQPEECIGLSAFDFVHPDDRESTREAFFHYIRERAQTGIFENRQVGRTGEISHMLWKSRFHYDGDGGTVTVDGIARDITERKKLEQQIQHAQKLESLGVLAGGIAHDFNNLLTSILGNADLAVMNLSPVSPARQNLDEIERASRRAADLCRQMLAYSGKGAFVIQPIDLNELVSEMAHLLEASLSKKAILKYELADDLPPIKADATQIHQIVMNLITNASESLGEGAGLIRIVSGTMYCSAEYLRDASPGEELSEGQYVYLQVSDNGCGMNEETLSRIFDPFFTTKFTGRGLGLAAVLGITRAHEGAIQITSEPGNGSTFRVLFPACGEPLDRSESVSGIASDWRGSGTVLLADDEAMVRRVAAGMLTFLGFEVLEAADGHEAVEVFRAHQDEILLVLLDMTMPRMSGEEAFDEIRKIKSDACVILSSGYTEQEAMDRFEGKGHAGFVQKPYKHEDLLEKIRRVLNE